MSSPTTASERSRGAGLGVALWLLAAAPAAYAQSKSPPLTRAQVQALARGTTTVSTPTTWYVDQVNGSDANACTATGTAACATINAAVARVPKNLQAVATVTVAAGTYTSGGANGDVFSCGAGGSLIIQGVLTTYSPATGTATGTATSGSAGSNATRGTLTDSGATWTTNDFRGQLLELTSGTGVGQMAQIEKNTGTVVTIEGLWSTAPDATTHYAVRDWASIIGGNLSNTFTWQTGVVTAAGPSAISAAFSLSGGPAPGSPPCITVKNFKFNSSVSRGILVWGGAVDISYNNFASLGSNPISIVGPARWDVHHNTFASASRRGVFAFGDSFTTAGYLHNNVLTAGAFLADLRGQVTGWEQWNYVNGAIGGALAIEQNPTWMIQYDIWEAFGAGSSNCISGLAAATSNTGAQVGVVTLDGVQCNDPKSTFFALGGPVLLRVDQSGTGVASTGTNANAVRLYDLNQGARAIWASTTAFTASGGASDIKLDSDVTAGVAVTLAGLQAFVPKSMCSAWANSCASETGGATTSATPNSMLGNLLVLGSAKNKGLITLSSGTGTATVASGAICTCSETTDATKTFKCPVSGTTLTATGTGSDVISYHCF